MERFRGKGGFPIRWRHEEGIHYENEFLYGVYEDTFCKNKPVKLKIDLYDFYNKIKNLNFPNHFDEKVLSVESSAKISHDQLTAYSCYSFQRKNTGEDGHKLIWDQIKWFKFQDRILHPRDWIYYGSLNKNIVALLLIPFYLILCFMSLFIGYRYKDGKIQPKLSGELLYILRTKTVENDTLLNILFLPSRIFIYLGSKIRFGSSNSMVGEYFLRTVGHPIVENVDL